MKLLCSKNDLLKGINIVSKAVPSKTTMTILECIYIDASTEQIKFTTNDNQLGIETIISGDIIEKGIVALNAKLFGDIIRKLPDSEIALETDENYSTNIICGQSKFTIQGQSGNDFPILPFIEKKEFIEISEFTLKEAIRQTIFSIADNDTNHLMTGELFKITDNELKIVAIDGHRASIRNILLNNNYGNQSYIIPGKSLNEISKILSGEDEKQVKIYFSDNQVIFEFDTTVVVTRLIEGEYFNIAQMISNSYETKVEINRKELLECIDRSILFVNESGKKPIIVNIKDDELQIKINSTIGSMDEKINMEKSGKDILIGLNAKFIMDALRVIDDEKVSLYFINSKSPCFIKDDEEKYIYMVLPINIIV
ncbi:DNA polymerase III, beta subunit [Acetitomaculum ruminis DSM 5522]|uniref:Beta sliding clamp n=1 Tax=Acetitomaculum ruminis DSM 5522 TaxID=1120918 RepID=A0A1I0ZE01_9FIRM|nr:DNA polymerase III subunit beta [Acetitomaculum ruminis]SFB23751.1 DNA polymerase III, beta subunit [Acetitomaculum ruminis DSM 5522]